MSEITEPPSKCVSQEVNIRVNAEVLYVDFEGKTDGESAVKIIEVGRGDFICFYFIVFFLLFSFFLFFCGGKC